MVNSQHRSQWTSNYCGIVRCSPSTHTHTHSDTPLPNMWLMNLKSCQSEVDRPIFPYLPHWNYTQWSSYALPPVLVFHPTWRVSPGSFQLACFPGGHRGLPFGMLLITPWRRRSALLALSSVCSHPHPKYSLSFRLASLCRLRFVCFSPCGGEQSKWCKMLLDGVEVVQHWKAFRTVAFFV